jgi:cytochrome c5
MTRLGVLVLVACHATAPVVRDIPLTRTVGTVDDEVIAVAEQGDALYLFARDRLTVERAGTAMTTVLPPKGQWAAAATIPALDGEGTWVVARSTAGGLWRITATGDIEPIHDRLGLPSDLHSISAAATTFGVTLDTGIAIMQDRKHVLRFSTSTPGNLVAGRDRMALLHDFGRFDVWDLAHDTHVEYRVPDAIHGAFLDAAHSPRLVVASETTLFVEGTDGLHPIAAPGRIRELAVAGSRLWVATMTGLYFVEAGRFVRTDADPARARLFGLANGDVLLVTPHAPITRLGVDHQSDDPTWDASIKPVFQRVCSKCHLPGGTAQVDLSTPAAWHTEHDELVRRIVETRTMPPAGTELSDADRKALADWLAR